MKLMGKNFIHLFGKIKKINPKRIPKSLCIFLEFIGFVNKNLLRTVIEFNRLILQIKIDIMSEKIHFSAERCPSGCNMHTLFQLFKLKIVFEKKLKLFKYSDLIKSYHPKHKTDASFVVCYRVQNENRTNHKTIQPSQNIKRHCYDIFHMRRVGQMIIHP